MDKEKQSPPRFPVLAKPGEAGPDSRLQRLINRESSSFQAAGTLRCGEAGGSRDRTGAPRRGRCACGTQVTPRGDRSPRSTHRRNSSPHLFNGTAPEPASPTREPGTKQATREHASAQRLLTKTYPSRPRQRRPPEAPAPLPPRRHLTSRRDSSATCRSPCRTASRSHRHGPRPPRTGHGSGGRDPTAHPGERTCTGTLL